MFWQFRPLFFAAFLLIWVPAGSTSNLNPGIVDLSRIKDASTQLTKRLQSFRTTRKRARKELRRIREVLQEEVKQIKNNRDEYSSEEIKSRKVTLQRKFRTLRRRRSRLTRFYTNRKEQIEKQYMTFLRRKLKRTAQTRGINVVFNKNADNNFHSVLWVAPKRDLTEYLLNEVRNGNPLPDSFR
jgi:Skp family chaperone for outer membrane proteins